MTTNSMTAERPDAPAFAAARLYGIVDLGYVLAEAAVGVAAELVAGGVDILQLRAKGAPAAAVERLARRLLPVTAAAGVPLIINDHAEIAAVLDCAGVHVGQEDASIARAREIVGPHKLVGRSTHSLAQALAAQAEGADYIGFGPLFATPTKPGRPAIGLDGVREVHRRVSLPVFCIGGVKLANLAEVTAAGARRVVVVSEILMAPDRAACARAIRARLGNSGKATGDSPDGTA